MSSRGSLRSTAQPSLPIPAAKLTRSSPLPSMMGWAWARPAPQHVAKASTRMARTATRRPRVQRVVIMEQNLQCTVNGERNPDSMGTKGADGENRGGFFESMNSCVGRVRALDDATLRRRVVPVLGDQQCRTDGIRPEGVR